MSVDIEHLARLARLTLEDADRTKVEKKISAVLEFFNQLAQVDTSQATPFFHASPEMEARADIPEAPLPVEELMKNAPDASENCFRIPKVVGDLEQ